jgi:hypothetical protein
MTWGGIIISLGEQVVIRYAREQGTDLKSRGPPHRGRCSSDWESLKGETMVDIICRDVVEA